MKPEVVLILYCLIALTNIHGSIFRQLIGAWKWNDITYGIRLFILSIPLYTDMRTLDVWNKFFFALLLFSNMVTILSDHKLIDLYDRAIGTPKVCFIIFVLFYNIYKLKHNKQKE